MKDCDVYPISELPFYFVESSVVLQFLSKKTPEISIQTGLLVDDFIDENIAPGFEHEAIVNSNKKNILVGNLGEEIAQAYLSTKYLKVKRISIEKSNKGYDIVANDLLCFEVKTSISKEYEFEITINELRIANNKKRGYYIFYIVIDTNKRTAIGFIFSNPIERFGIEFDNLTRQISIFEPTKFRGKLQEHIHLAEKVELTEMLTKVLVKKPEYVQTLFTASVERLSFNTTA